MASTAGASAPNCRVRLSTGYPFAGDVITMLVTTTPGAKVSGTSAQYPGGYSWAMQPTKPGNGEGHAWLYQKISVPLRSGAVSVTVHAWSHGSYGECHATYRVIAQ